MPTVRGAIARIKRSLTPSEYIFAGRDWEKAEQRFKPRGWSAPSVLEQYQNSWNETLKSLTSPEMPHILAAKTAFEQATVGRTGSMRVLDWGGGLGQYLALFRSVRPDLHIDYVCYDLPILANEGHKYWPDARFVSEVKEVEGKFDFVLASSSLQYVRDWKGELKILVDRCRGSFFLTRCPVSQAATHILLQSAYGSEWLGWVLNERELVNYVEQRGLKLSYRIVINPIKAQPGIGKPAHIQCGFLFE